MCLAVFAIDMHKQWPLVVAANRDEYHARAALTMQPWPEAKHVLAGRDLQAGGMWLGIDDSSRLALLTNVRDPIHTKPDAPSRGRLAQNFLTSDLSAKQYLDELANQASQYNGFNLVVVDPINASHRHHGLDPLSNGLGFGVWHASNYQQPFASTVKPGIHAISNALLDTQWPKTERTTKALAAYLSSAQSINPRALTEIMLDTRAVEDALLPSTGVTLERERLLATPFIIDSDYGTRCTTIVLRHRSGLCWVQEDSYDQTGTCTQSIKWWHTPGQAWQQTQMGPESLITV